MHISEYRFFSFLHDMDMVRVSVWDEQGDEYFALVPDGTGYAARRAEAVEALELAIEDEQPAGEVFPFGSLMENTHFTYARARA